MKNKLNNNAIIVIIFCVLMLIIGYINFLTAKINTIDNFIGISTIIFLFYIVYNKKLKRVNIQNAGVVFIVSLIGIYILYFSIPSKIIEKVSFLMYIKENFESLIYIIVSITATYLYFNDKKYQNKTN